LTVLLGFSNRDRPIYQPL